MATKDRGGVGGVVRELSSGVIGGVRHFKKLMLALFASLAAAAVLLPLWVVTTASLKPDREFFDGAINPPTEWQFQNLIDAWTIGGFSGYMLNSLIVATVGLAILLTICLLAAYALVQFDIPKKRYILLGIIAGFMIPPEVLVVPLYNMMDGLGWLNQLRSVILVYVAMAIPFSVFFIRQFFISIPGALAEAARMDGCSEFQVFTRVYLPLSVPAVTTVFVFNFVLFWNEFLYAIIFLTRDQVRTAPAGLLAFQGQFEQSFTMIAAGVIIAALPTIIVFLLFRDYFIRGFTMGRV